MASVQTYTQSITDIEHFSPIAKLQSGDLYFSAAKKKYGTPDRKLARSKPCVTTFLSVISHQISVLAASTNRPSDFSSKNAQACNDILCDKWLFVS